MYTLMGSPQNRSFRVLWMLEELGIKYKLQTIQSQSAEAKSVNPSGKVPALKVDDQIIIDSVAIMQFLADKHNALTFTAGSVNRAKQDSFTQLVVDDFDACLWTAWRHAHLLPEEHRVPDIITTQKMLFDLAITNLDTRMSNSPYLMGDVFTVPDIVLSYCLAWARKCGFSVPTSGKIAAHIEACAERDAFKRADSIRNSL